MDQCPKCQHQTLIYDPYTKKAKCLRIECGYKESINSTTYRFKFIEGKTEPQQLEFFTESGKI